MKILIFGGGGQLGSEIRVKAADLAFQVAAPVAKEVDVRESAQVDFLVRSWRPDVVINCAGFTAIDRAESEPDLCFAINRDGALNVARSCRAHGARLLTLSTDYVFDGSLNRPLEESDAPNPLNVYGRSKLAGELAVREVLGDAALIVRTQSLFGRRGNNFLHTLLTLARQRSVMKIASDHITSPTPATWLAGIILDLIRLGTTGTVHAAAGEGASLYQVAQFALASYKEAYPGEAVAQIEPTTTAAISGAAVRPRFLTLSTSRLESLIGRPVPAWQEGVSDYVRSVGAGK